MDLTGRLARWPLRLSEYEFELVHGGGIEHQAADEVSWLALNSTDMSPFKGYIPLLSIAILTPNSTPINNDNVAPPQSF